MYLCIYLYKLIPLFTSASRLNIFYCYCVYVN